MTTPALLALFLMVVTTLYILMIGVYTIMLVTRRQGISPGADASPVRISVIIAVRNESVHIERLLNELANQDYSPGRYEVIISDDSSEDLTMQLAASFAGQHPAFNLRTVSPGLSAGALHGKKPAIERAVKVAQGEILLLTDADTSRGNGWITAMAEAFHDARIMMALGPVRFDNPQNLLQRIQQLEFLGIMGTTAGSARSGHPVMCNGANLAYRKEVFDATGGFRTHLKYLSGDDQFMMSAVKKKYGAGSVYFHADRSAIVTTEAERSLAGFIHQRIRWVSKSRGYRDPVVMGVGALTFLVHLLLPTGAVWGLFYPPLAFLAIFLWLFKIVAEFPMVWLMGRFFGIKTGPAGHYLISQLFQLVYVPLAGIFGLFLPFRWKGRKG